MSPVLSHLGGADEVLLRPWQIDDARWYVQARDDEVFRWTIEPRALTVDEAKAAIEETNQREDVYSFAIVDPESRELLGNIALVKDKGSGSTAEVMYWLAPWGRGRGIATKAVRLVCQWAFTQLGCERITLKTHVDNARSRRVAERAGFRRSEQQDEDREQSGTVWYVLTNEQMKPAI